MRVVVGTLLAMLVLLPAASAQEQAEPLQTPEAMRNPSQGGLEAILHRDTFFGGQFHSVRQATPDLRLNWDPRSIRIRSGEWQICTGRNYTGTCRTIDRDLPTLPNNFRTIQSIRPTGGFGTGVGNSLRGATAEFFPAPLRNGQRIPCQNASCARTQANQFCRSVGWIVARSQALDNVGGQSVVADVLCARNVF
ncbi:beta/gamma crystallin-related protein [Altererythrobacter sp. Root672]|uniref:beta/gamma crystallin-related protein n=1 Tax=Altererythrobacter sp. Root672 TaxID=1736584 RepID=UPI0006FD8E52|nr:beta/gamma crystallin-related protein [Altererythrobacter sp. Root672]KRA82699.1 hypothetical protein ASD76_00965 [Altererythrobacter sp. Root672]